MDFFFLLIWICSKVCFNSFPRPDSLLENQAHELTLMVIYDDDNEMIL